MSDKLSLIETLDGTRLCSHKLIHSFKCSKIPELKYIGNNVLNVRCSCKEQEMNMTIPSYLAVTEIICKETTNNAAAHSEEALPEMFCDKCKCWLCKECSSLHDKEHKVNVKEFKMQIFCAVHPKKHIIGYCEQCEAEFCSECLADKTHENHYIKTLDYVCNDVHLKEINRDYKKALKFIRNQEKVYNSAIDQLKLKITQLTNAYELYLDNQYSVLKLLHLLINSYNDNKNNYFIRKNIINNSLFSLKECKADPTFEEVITYFEHSIILSEGQRKSNTKLPVEPAVKKLIHFKEENISQITCIQVLHDGRIAVSSRDNMITVYSIDLDNVESSKADIKITNVHKRYGGVRYITEIREGIIATCGMSSGAYRNDSIKIYGLRRSDSDKMGQINGGMIVTMVLFYSKEKFISCSSDGYVRMWDSRSFDKKNEWEAHNCLVKAMLKLQKKNVLITIGDSDHLLKQWDLDTFVQLNEPITHITCPGPNAIIETPSGKLLMGKINKVQIIDLKNLLIEKEIIPEPQIPMNVYYSFMIIGDLVYGVSGIDETGCLFIFNLYSGEQLYLRRVSPHPTFVIKKLNERTFITGCNDIKIINYYYLTKK